jgi:phosphoglycerate kinase
VGDTPAALRGLPQLEDLGALSGKRVLVRADFNVPLEEGPGGVAVVADDFRIRATVPTLDFLIDHGAEVVCCTHLGRPKGTVDDRFDVAPVRAVLDRLRPGVRLLENLRFDPGEEDNDAGFVDRLVDGFDAYVNDAFGASHRAHASVVGPPARLPSAAGRRLAREVEVLGGLLESPPRPFVAILGGAKVADKLGVVASIAKVADVVVVGGAMAFTFLAARGHAIGASLVDAGRVADCRALLDGGATIVLPTDVLALSPGASFGAGAADGETRVFDGDLADGWTGLDVGPSSIETFRALVSGAATILWNGPLGAFEDARFATGTDAVAHAVADADAFSVVGGGDSAMALSRAGLADRVSFLSTGGGATLELLEHGDLPALAALRAASNAPVSR